MNDLAWLVRFPIDPWTYRSLGYALLTVPMAIVYLVGLTVGLTMSVAQ